MSEIINEKPRLALVNLICSSHEYRQNEPLVREKSYARSIIENGYNFIYPLRTTWYFRKKAAHVDIEKLMEQAWLFLDEYQKSQPEVDFYIQAKNNFFRVCDNEDVLNLKLTGNVFDISELDKK